MVSFNLKKEKEFKRNSPKFPLIMFSKESEKKNIEWSIGEGVNLLESDKVFNVMNHLRCKIFINFILSTHHKRLVYLLRCEIRKQSDYRHG